MLHLSEDKEMKHLKAVALPLSFMISFIVGGDGMSIKAMIWLELAFIHILETIQ